MATTRANLDIQSDKVLTEAQLQTRLRLRDAAAVQSLFLDWVEPAAADRTVTFQDPGGDDDIVYRSAAQVLENKQTTTVPSVADDLANKGYVDTTIAGAFPTATSGSGGATEGKLTMDEDKGLLIAGGIAEVKVDGATLTFNGGGQLTLVGGATPNATSGSGGGIIGIITADTDKGLFIDGSTVMEVKVDGSSIQFNGSGELEIVGAGGAGPTGLISGNPSFTEDIGGVTPPTAGTTGGGDISTLDHLTGVINGTRWSFAVPDDYFSGPMTISVVQQMSSADPAGSVEIETTALIVDVSSGVIDSVTYPATQSTLSVPTTTDVRRDNILSMSAGDFSNGDVIQILYKRLGNDVGDVHPGDQQVIEFLFSYVGVVDGRVANRQAKLFANAPGETPTTPNTISGGDISVEDFPTGIDTGLKFEFTVPDNWDGISAAEVRLVYVMSANDAPGVVRLETRGKNARGSTGAIDTITPVIFDFTPGAGTAVNPKQTTSIISIPSTALSAGDAITLIVARRGLAVADTHTGDFQLLCGIIRFGTLASGGVTGTTILESYLNQGVFGNATGGVTGDTDFVDLVDFETYDRLESSTPGGLLDIAYEGRLGGLQTTIREIRFFIKGTGASPMYTLNVYAEGTGIVHTDGPIAAPVGTTEVVKTDLDLSAQPMVSGRFFVIFTASIDSGEAVLVSRPFVKAE